MLFGGVICRVRSCTRVHTTNLPTDFLGDYDQKPTGKRVWSMADEKECAAIERWYKGEVREIVALIM
ncbi:MAG TPA: hypothetical protein O0X23_00295 [Methanocorpusculum sp.]|nr:hypothetical protein [Methanocorpusculum sp.]